MKKVLTLTLILIALTVTSQAQTTIKLGIEGGVNIANVSTTPNFTTSSRTGIIGGGTFDLGFSPNFGILSGIRYNMKGYETVDAGVTYKVKLGYLEFPVLLKVKFPLTEVKPYLIAGPLLGIKLSAEEEASNGVQTQTTDVSASVESIDFNLLFGGGLDFRVGTKTDLFIQPAYALGLSNILKNNTTTTIKTNGFQITGGVKFGL